MTTTTSAKPGGMMKIANPEDGNPVGSVPMASADEVRSTIDRAVTSTVDWSRESPAERGAMLRAAAATLRASEERLAKLNHAETGKPMADARGGVLAGAGTLEQYAELGPLHRGKTLQGGFDATDFMAYQPRGVVVALTPWNDPVAVACGLIGAALVTGNAVIHKPSERAPQTGELLGKLIAETHPSGVLSTVSGDASVGELLTDDPRVGLIAHVGGVATGRRIAGKAASNGTKTLLENGGNDPLIVDADVDLRWAARQTALGSFANAGQICVSVERIYVHQDIAESFMDALVDEAGKQEIPPLVDTAHRELVHQHVAEALAAGAEARTGGELPPGAGARYPATVLTGCTPEMRVLSEETFGPVAPVRIVSGFGEALREAASGPYGLGATVLTNSMAHVQRAWRELQVGSVKINSVFGGAPGGAAEPRGISGQGFGYGPELLDEMTVTKVVHLEPAGPKN